MFFLLNSWRQNSNTTTVHASQKDGGAADVLLDDSCYRPAGSSPLTTQGGPMVVNDLVLRDLRRSHLKRVLACRAANNDVTPPAVASVTLDMTCKSTHTNKTFLL